jgi:hypothetical protein
MLSAHTRREVVALIGKTLAFWAPLAALALLLLHI